ncbi:MAG: beta-lactamase family protein [Gammaproteobacteria bacterium]|nr:beta-lactamase family protein [Gammaproteobacteria bacterium]
MRAALVLILYALALGGCSMSIPTKPYENVSDKAQRYGEMKQELTAWIKKGMRKHKITGMSIALLDEGEIVWAEGFGWADKNKQRQADVNTLYKAGSISKVFTASAVMQLVEQGKVDLDVPIQTYIPELKPKYHFEMNTPITLRQIMSHRSGLTGDRLSGMFTEHPKRFDTIIEHLNRVHHPYAPNTVTAYSNLATDLQGIVIERVTGERFEDYMEQHILKPLGMKTSTFNDGHVVPELMSQAYRHNKEGIELPLRDLPAGNLYTSALELSRFANMVMQNGDPILEPNSIRKMLQPQVDMETTHGLGGEHGLNWVIDEPDLNHLGRVAWHNGGTIHFFSYLVILPDHGLSLVVLANSDTALAFEQKLVHKILKQAAAIKSGTPIIESTPTHSAYTPMPASMYQSLPGMYATMAGPLKLSGSGKTVKGKFMGLTIKLSHHEDGWLSPHPRLFGVIPLPAKIMQGIRIKPVEINGDRLLIADYKGSILPIAVRVEPYTIPPQWNNFKGKYTLDEADTSYNFFHQLHITESHGYIIISTRVPNQGKLKLIVRSVSDNTGVLESYGRSGRETIYFENANGRPAIRLLGYHFIKDE